MAKNSVKSSTVHRQMVPLHKSYRWTQQELEALPSRYAGRVERRVSRMAGFLNLQLRKSAFEACDKEAYAAFQANQKLQRYDVRRYRQQRAVNHGCAKKIFAAIHAGKDWTPALAQRDLRADSMARSREQYVASLEAEKKTFVARHPRQDDGAYVQQKKQLQQKLDTYSGKLQQKSDASRQRREERLNRKLRHLENRMAALHKRNKSGLTLPEDVLLRVEGLKMYFGGLKAVDDLTFDVKKGEIFGLIGPNGAGKTTVFNCITRFYDATGGQMYFENKQGEVVDLRAFQVHDVITQGISRTFQNVELVKEISVLDNLLVACTQEYRSGLLVQALGLPSLRKEERLLKEKARKVLKFMGLESYANWLAMGLPYGVLKKVEIARALMSDARLIVMDEPAAGLNDSETAELTRTIRRIRDEFGVTILLVEHDMSLVMNVCDTICAISFGKMLAIGNCEQIKADKGVQEAYLGVEEDAV